MDNFLQAVVVRIVCKEFLELDFMLLVGIPPCRFPGKNVSMYAPAVVYL